MYQFVICEFQGFQTNENSYIVKELVFVTKDNQNLFFFKPPYDWLTFNVSKRRANSWCERHYHRIPYNYGHYDYSQVKTVLKNYTHLYPNVFTKGKDKQKFLETMLQRQVLNLEDYFLNIERDDSSSCGYHSGVCALKNANDYFKFLTEDQNVFDFFF